VVNTLLKTPRVKTRTTTRSGAVAQSRLSASHV